MIATEISQALQAVHAEFQDALTRADAARIVALHTQDAQVLPPSRDIVMGRAALQSFWQGLMDMGIRSETMETVEVERHGDIVYEVVKYTVGNEGGQVLDRGKCITIWKQEDGQWRWHRCIWNSSMSSSG
jgi:ketosteroid isomerase-like protein